MEEKKDIKLVGDKSEDWQVFNERIKEIKLILHSMVENGTAYIQVTRNKEGKSSVLRVFRSDNGALLYFEDIESIIALNKRLND